MGGPSGNARIDPRDSLPLLSADQWMAAIKRVADGAARVLQQARDQTAADQKMQARMDAYFNGFYGSYKVGGVEVKAAPFFRMANGAAGSSEAMKGKVFAVTGTRTKAFSLAVHRCAYGRCTPEQLQMVTQALIDKGKLAEVRARYEAEVRAVYDAMRLNPEALAEFEKVHGKARVPLSNEDAIKLLQYEYGLGIDCAGYVQQAFLAVKGGSRASWGFQPKIGDENLAHPRKEQFRRAATPVEARPGDFIVLMPPEPKDVGHTVLVRDRRDLTADEAKALTNFGKFAEAGDRVHRIEVQGSWGAGYGNLDTGGLQTRMFLYNEVTDQWADVEGGAVVQKEKGPYNHPLDGIYHPRR